MSLFIGRISYLPDDEKLSNIRFYEQNRALNSLRIIAPKDAEIITVAQNWKGKQSPNQIIFEYPKLGPAKARNILLEKLYQSDYDYALICDDDASLYDYYGIQGMISEINDNEMVKKFIKNNVHIFKAIEPVYTPFKKINANLPLDSHYLFHQAPMTNGGALFFIINFKKFFNQEFYFEDLLEENCREDIDFFIRIIKSGYNVLESRNMIQKNYCNNIKKSTIFIGHENINDIANEMMRNTAKRHKMTIVNNRIQFNSVLNYYKGYLYIPRKITWDYSDVISIEEGLF